MPEDPGSLLVANLPLVERLSRAACRGSNMSDADVDDFVSMVKLKLVENDYAVLRAFQGRCSLPTFLALAIHRQLLDHRAHAWGRFRPSAEAQRLGAVAIRLESLVVRDETPMAEALEMLRREGQPITPEEAERILSRLPKRRPHPVAVPLDDLDVAATTDVTMPRERAAASRITSAAMRQAIAGLPVDDQAVLQMHFAGGMAVADVARALGADQQQLYRRIRRLCVHLRERLLAAGIDAARVRELLETSDAELDFGLDAMTKRGPGPSTGEEADHG